MVSRSDARTSMAVGLKSTRQTMCSRWSAVCRIRNSFMTFGADDSRGIERGPVVWITGLAGVGKSTLAALVVSRLRDEGRRPLLLDGDEMRSAIEGDDAPVQHRHEDRLLRAWRLARLARLASGQG